MLTVLLASATAGLFGVADFLGGLASRRESAVLVTATAHGVGVVIFSFAVLAFRVPFDRPSAIAGAVAGVGGGIGVAALYAALARGSMSVIAPLTAAISGSVPAVYDFATGSRVGATSLAGLALAFVATVVVSATSASEKDENRVPPSAVALALLAGITFAGSIIAFSFAADSSGFWPHFSARVTSFSLLFAVALLRVGRVRPRPDARKPALGAGVLDTAANIAMISAIRVGPLAVASVLGSLYPVGTVLLARVVLGERLRGWQRLGVGLAFVAVILTALPWPLRFG